MVVYVKDKIEFSDGFLLNEEIDYKTQLLAPLH